MIGDKGMGFPTDGVDNQGWKLYITSLVMIIVAGLFVVFRCTTRYSMHKLGWEDAAVVLSLNGYGMHKADLTKPELRSALKLFFIAQTPYKVTVCLNKIAAILLYLRLFVSATFRKACFVAMAIIVAWSIGGVGATIWQCVPIEGAWNKAVEAKCIDSSKFWIAYAVMNILTDVMVLLLPLPSIMALQMGMRERLLLCSVFLLGGFVTVTSILRTTSVQNSLKNKEDSTYNFIERGMWTLIEANLGIIAACLPVLKRPMSKLFPQIFGFTKKSSAYNTHVNSKGYNLSNVSASASHPGLWRGATKNEQLVSVSGPEPGTGRKSDERHIVAESLRDSDPDSDLDSHPVNQGRISKRVEVTRTSFHEYNGLKD
ncbi:hypothetical protein G7Z17_g1790 [Cylindrodendrum hubeiense]|uniref:Rhodopsin domain-containing protein n=1 Tax=Cylindrodendrum hubeiense TaxID=595255 RepID=A0A9P5HE53_9HYPO|nr:hypothetical protein G7Z17_g1790 [Cylindrodendrum hubeiense]